MKITQKHLLNKAAADKALTKIVENFKKSNRTDSVRKARLSSELKQIISRNWSRAYLVSYYFTDMFSKNNTVYTLNGTSPSSLIAYLMKLSKNDPVSLCIPLPIFSSQEKPDFTMCVPDWTFESVIISLMRIVHGEFRAGLDMYTITSEDQIIELAFILRDDYLDTDEIFFIMEHTVWHEMGGLQGLKIIIYDERNDDSADNTRKMAFSIFFMRNPSVSLLNMILSFSNGMSLPNALLADKEVQRLIAERAFAGIPCLGNSFVQTIVPWIPIDSFNALLRLLGISLGNSLWVNNAEDLLEEHVLSVDDIISCAEDIYNYLYKRNVGSKIIIEALKAIKLTEKKNQIKELLLQKGISPVWILHYDAVSGLLSKAQYSEYAWLISALLYAKAHQPKLFYHVCLFTLKLRESQAEEYFDILDNIEEEKKSIINEMISKGLPYIDI